MQIQVNDFSLAYSEAGSGMGLLLVHGFPLNRRLWAPQLDGLADAARVLAPDLRGHGESQAVSGPYSMDSLADDLNAFLDALEVSGPVVVCGLSMGGYVALSFYRRYASRVAGLILAATRAGADSAEAKAKRDEMVALAGREGAAAVSRSMLPKMLAPQTYAERPVLVENVRLIMDDTSLDGVQGALLGMRDRVDSTGLLGELDRPVLILHGAEDQIIPVKEAEAMQAALPRARLEVLPAAGHLLNLEQPELFNDSVRSFLATINTTLRT